MRMRSYKIVGLLGKVLVPVPPLVSFSREANEMWATQQAVRKRDNALSD